MTLLNHFVLGGTLSLKRSVILERLSTYHTTDYVCASTFNALAIFLQKSWNTNARFSTQCEATVLEVLPPNGAINLCSFPNSVGPCSQLLRFDKLHQIHFILKGKPAGQWMEAGELPSGHNILAQDTCGALRCSRNKNTGYRRKFKCTWSLVWFTVFYLSVCFLRHISIHKRTARGCSRIPNAEKLAKNFQRLGKVYSYIHM